MSKPELEFSINDLEKGPPPLGKYDQQQDMTQSISLSAYYDRVVGLKLEQRPWLESLYQFMDPKAQGFAIDLAKRIKHFDIKIVNFPKSGKPDSVIKCSTPEDFEAAFGREQERRGAFVIAKGISRAMIEVLGNRFELEPEFFASYLEGTELYRMGKAEQQSLRAPARAPVFLPAYIRKAPFYTLEYRRPYRIEGGIDRVIGLRVSETSTPRGITSVHESFCDYFVSEKVSVYKRKGSDTGKKDSHDSSI
jgi:hypothetical protein